MGICDLTGSLDLWPFRQVFDGHNGVSAAVFSKEHLLEHVMSALPPDIGSREDWLQALPRALVAGFVKADIDFQRKGETDRVCRWRLRSTPVEHVAEYLWLC